METIVTMIELVTMVVIAILIGTSVWLYTLEIAKKIKSLKKKGP